MDVTEVKVKLVAENRDRLKAYCTMTLDGAFVVRDLKLIEGANGLFVAMPSRKLADRCASCGGKNHLRGRYCNNCGNRLDENRGGLDREGRPKLHADIAHPINSECRERIQKAIETAYHAEVERSKLPGYKPVSLEEDEDVDYEHLPPMSTRARSSAAASTTTSQSPSHKHDEGESGAADSAGEKKSGEGLL